MSEAPYRDAAELYYQAGWRGVLPVFERGKRWSKRLSIRGFTGHDGIDPSWPDIQAWQDGPEGDHNIALRMPDGVIGIDVDGYGAKQGGATFAKLIEQAGELPSTWNSSARDDGISAIRFFRVPCGLAWPGEAGPHVEIVQRVHRYAVVWPSWNPDAEARYHWQRPDGTWFVDDGVPSPDEMAELPAAWVQLLSRGPYAAPQRAIVGDIAAQLAQWNRAEPCRTVRHAVSECAARMRQGSRHEAMRNGAGLIVDLCASGHGGLAWALDAIRADFMRAADDRSADELAGEWDRSLVGAVERQAAGGARDVQPCICDDDPAQLAPPADVDDGAPRAQRLAERPSPPGQVETAGAAAEPAGGSSGGLVLAGPMPSTQPQTPLQAEIERQRLIREARRALDAEEALRDFREPIYTRDLREELLIPEIDEPYAIPEIMPHGANVLLTAAFKAGKTTLLNNLARSMADGEPFLGKFRPAHMTGRIALFNYEVSRQQFARWLREHRIVNQDRITVLPLRGFSLPITTKFAQDWVVEWLKRHEIEMWIPDPFARAFVGCGDNENDNSQVGRFLDAIDIIKERAGVPNLAMSTHTGRAEMMAGQERARGATRLDDWADVRWLLTVDREIRYFRATGRDVDYAETALTYDAGTHALTLGDGDRAGTRSQQVQDAIVAVVRARPGMSITALRTEVREFIGSASTDAITQAIGVLKRAERLRVEIDGVATRHYVTNPTEILSSMIPR